jgi:hypothetical protein
MTYLAPIPRVRPSGWLIRLSGAATANRPPVPVETRAPRRLSDEELSPWAEKRGDWNDDIEPLPRREGLILTLLFAFMVGAPLFLLALHWLVGAVFGAVMAIRFPEIGVY